METDIEIAQSSKMMLIEKIAAKIGISENKLEHFGKYKAKVTIDKKSSEPKGKLILVTAINPIPAGEGKTTTSVGLGDALQKLVRKLQLLYGSPL